MSTEDRLRGLFSAKGDEIAESVDHESIRPEPRRRPSWIVAVVAAAGVLLVIGGVGLFARSGDGPVLEEATDTSTTTASAAAVAVATGPTLTWTEIDALDVGDGYVATILVVDGGYLAYAETWDETNDASSLQAYRSADGTQWNPATVTGPSDARTIFPHTVTQGGPGFVAVGMESEESATPYGPDDGAFLAWTSTDGLAWEAHQLPQPDRPDVDPLVAWFPSVENIAVSDAGIVAAGMAHADIMFEPLVAEHLGITSDEAMETICGYNVSPGGTDGGAIEVFSCPPEPVDGPSYEEELLFTATFAELGISEEAAQAIMEPSEQALIWYSADGFSWELLEDPLGAPAFITSVAATDSGFFAVAHGPMRPGVFHSVDGRTWEATAATPEDGDIDRIVERNGVLYATGWQRNGGAALWTSTDGVVWTTIDLSTLFGGEDGQHSIWEMRGGGLGLLAQAESWVDPFVDAEPVVLDYEGFEITVWPGEGERVRIVDAATGEVLLEGGPWEYREPEPFELERNGYRLEMDLRNMTATLTDLATGAVVLEVEEPTGFDEPEGMRTDDEGVFTFYDPASDEVYLTVSWQEIDELLGLSPPYQRWDEEGIHYLDPETGEEIVLVPHEVYGQAMDAAYRAADGNYQQPDTALVFSPDGTAWSRQPTVDAFGEAGWIESIAVGDDAVVVVFRPHGDEFPTDEATAELYEPPTAQIWLGTLAG